MNQKAQVSWQLLCVLLLFAYVACFYVIDIHFINADLGRHIKNGEVFFQTLRPIATNFYSYTEPNQPAINHHWGTGIVFYLIWKYFGFGGLWWFNLIMFLTAFKLFWMISRRLASFKTSLFFALLTVPLVAYRTEIRPEVLSYVFLGVYSYLLLRFRAGEIRFQHLAPILLVLQVLWVNVHVYFLFGFFVLAVFCLDAYLNQSDAKHMYKLLMLAAIALLSSVLNPFGWRGALQPFMILQEVTYPLLEQQPLLYFLRLYWYDVYFMFESGVVGTGADLSRIVSFAQHLHFALLIVLIGMVVGALGSTKLWKENIIGVLFLFVFGVGCLLMVRVVPIFGYFVLSFGAGAWERVISLRVHGRGQGVRRVLWLVLGIWIGVGLLFRANTYHPIAANQTVGAFGLKRKINASAEFFKTQGLKGPIFNNYGIGGYLIHHLFPDEGVFVDNRPEAYSDRFLNQLYVSIQQNDAVWRVVDKQYQFNVIYYLKTEGGSLATTFLGRRVKDVDWAVIYDDPEVVIMLRRTSQNKPLIEALETEISLPEIDKFASYGLFNRARMHMKKGRYHDARRDLLEAVWLDPYDVDIRALLSSMERKLGNLKAAARHEKYGRWIHGV